MGNGAKLRVLMAVLLFFVLAEGMFYFALPIALETLTRSTLVVGVLMSLPSAVSFLSTEPAGDLSDKVGRRPIMVAGVLLSLLVYSVIFISDNILLIAALLAVYGLRDSLFYTSLEARVMDITPGGREGEYNGLLWLPFEFGYSVSVIFAAMLLQKSVGSVYASAFALTALSLFVLLLAGGGKKKLLSFKKLIKFTKRSFMSSPSHMMHLTKARKTEKLMFLFSFTSSVLGSVIWIVVPLLTVMEGLSLMDAALIMFAYSIPSAFSDIVGGEVFDRWRSRWFFFLAFMASTVAFAYFAKNADASALPFFFVSSTLLSAMWVGAMATVSSLHSKHRGGHAGLFFAGGYLGDMTGALLTGVLGSVSLMWPVYAAALLSFSCAVLTLNLDKKDLAVAGATQI